MKTKKLKTITVLFVLGMFLNQIVAQEQLGWRGVDRSGHYKTQKLLTEWPIEGPKLLLEVDSLPKTYSSIVVKDEVIYTTGVNDTAEILTAINMKGEILWETIYGKSWKNSYSNARCTPTIEGSYAYLISGGGYMACVDINKGELKWSFDAYEKFEGKCGNWGTAESPLVVDDKMIYTPCGKKTTLIAVDKNSGETIWQSQSLNDQSAYCSPIMIERNGLKIIVSVTGNYVVGVNSENGAFLWKFKYTDIEKPLIGGDINPVTPLVKGNDIFVTSGYNHVGIMLKMSDDCKSVSLKWQNEDLDTHHGGVLEHKGYIYGSNYTTLRNGNWLCVDWETGETKYNAKWLGYKGSIISADDLLICYDERKGNVALVEANPDKFEVKSTFRVEKGKGPHWSHPSIYDDKLFIRHGNHLLVYAVAE